MQGVKTVFGPGKHTLNIADTELLESEATEFQILHQKNAHIVWMKRFLSLSMIQVNYYYYYSGSNEVIGLK